MSIVDLQDSENRLATQRVAIVGGGAAGALAAVHLLRERRERGRASRST